MQGSQGQDQDPRAGKPGVSLVMPVYNGQRYLRGALDSVFAQTFGDFELIAVDDCSTDDTAAILAEYAASEPRMTVVTLAENRRLPAALNAGFARARADWLSWTSDDNLLLPHTLQALVEERDAEPSADIIYADYRIIDEEGTPTRRVAVGPSKDLLSGNVVGCCFLYRRAVHEATGGYNEKLFGVEDYDFWLRAAQHGFAFHPVHRELYLYRRHAGSLTDTRARQNHALVAKVVGEHIAVLDPSPRRAGALVDLATRNPYTFRPDLIFLALRDHPPTVARKWREIVSWLRTSLAQRLR